MIPVTQLQRQDGRGLRPRRQRPRDRAPALAAGGADVAAWDDSAATRRGGGSGRHPDRRSPRRPTGSASPRWCSRPACRSPIPSRTGRCVSARGGRRRDHRRHRAVLPRAAAERARRAVRRHHRHQRQVDHHGADRPSPRDGRPRRRSSAAISARPILSLEPPRTGRYHVIECSSFQIDLAPTPRSDGRRPPQRHARPSRPPRHACEHYAAHQGAAGRRRRRPRSSPSTTTCCQAIADRIEQAGRQRRPRLGAPAAGRRRLSPTAPMLYRRRRRRVDAASPILAGIGSLRGAHNAQNAAAAVAAVRRLGLDRRRRSSPACASFPGPAASHGAGRPARPRPLRQRFQGDQCRRRGQGAGELRPHLLDRRRPAEGRRHRQPRRLLPAHRQGLSDRRGGGGLRGDARRRGAASRCRARSPRRSRPPPPTPRATRRRSRSCCCRRPARPTTSSRISSGAAMPSARSSLALDGRPEPVGRPPDGQPRRSLPIRRVVVDRRQATCSRRSSP